MSLSSSTHPQPPPIPPGIEEWRVEVDGARMRYLSCGAGPPLLPIHGLLGYSFSWRLNCNALAQRRTVYAPDLLGTGFSERPATLDCTLRANAGRLARFLDLLGITNCDVLGTSYGGAIAI